MFWPVFGEFFVFFLHLPASLYTTQPLVSCFSALARCLVKTDTTVLFKAAFKAVTLSTYAKVFVHVGFGILPNV